MNQVIVVKNGKVKVYSGMAARSFEVTKKLQEEMRCYQTALDQLLPKTVIIPIASK